MRTLSCLLIVLLLTLAACTPDEIVPEESVVSAPISVTRETATPEVAVVTVTAVPPTITVIPSATATAVLPTIAPTSLPTETNTSTPTTRPTTTLQPTETPTSAPTPLPTHYDLPVWLNDPEAEVLMAAMFPEYNSEEPIIIFINVSSGEKFYFPVLYRDILSTDLAWGRDENGLYFEFTQNETVTVAYNRSNKIPKYIHRVYLATGDVIVLAPDTVSEVDSEFDINYRPVEQQGEEFGYTYPCIEGVCFEEVLAWAEEASVRVGMYELSKNGKMIEFVYWGYEPDSSGLCQIEIENHALTCLLDESNFGEPDNHGRIYYILELLDWSLGEEYLAFVANNWSPGGDDASTFQIATIAKDGSQFQIWGWSWGLEKVFWRPPINP